MANDAKNNALRVHEEAIAERTESGERGGGKFSSPIPPPSLEEVHERAYMSSGPPTVTGSTSKEGGQTVEEALEEVESREGVLEKSEEEREAIAERLGRKYAVPGHEDQYRSSAYPSRIYGLYAAMREAPVIAEYLPEEMVKDIKDFHSVNFRSTWEEKVTGDPEGLDPVRAYGSGAIPGVDHRDRLRGGPLAEQRRLLEEMKQDAGYNSLTTEMINKKNGGDK